MYTILLDESNELVATVRERIMQRSKLVDSFHFLVEPEYKGVSMGDFTVMMEYLLPVSREYRSEILVKSDELYKDMLEYMVPFDTCLTREAGDIEVQLTFVKVGLDADGNSSQQVRKTSPVTITIVPISAWSDIVADSALTAVDQRLIQAEALLNALNDTTISQGSGGIYVPDVSSDGILTMTLNEEPGEPSYSWDINPSNDWNEIQQVEPESDYVWEEL